MEWLMGGKMGAIRNDGRIETEGITD